MSTKTYSPTQTALDRGEIRREWHVVDAAGVPLGRLSSVVARLLTGKHKPVYAPHIDVGDFVIVINADQVLLTGRKESQKVYYRHSGYLGGLKAETAERLRQRRPALMVERAVWGMLPKHRMGRRLIRKLKVYGGAEHPHKSQKPQPLDLRAAGVRVPAGSDA